MTALACSPTLRLVCSKGTYVRSLAADLGQPTIEESYQVDFTKFETMVRFPLRHDFESGARDLVRRVAGRTA